VVGRDEYDTRESLDVLVEVENKPGNYLRIPIGIAGKIGLRNGDKIPRSMLKNHDHLKI